MYGSTWINVETGGKTYFMSHNLKVAGSNPAPATKIPKENQ